MRRTVIALKTITLAALMGACASGPQVPATGPMGFFITSVGTGNGANLGGLAGADAHCQKLAAAAGAGSRTWRAYLSVPGVNPSAAASAVQGTHARERIGRGPWFNAKGVLIARDVNHLHNGNNINKATALDERGNPNNGVGDRPLEHDILTGSRADGTAFSPHLDTTCKAWTSNNEGSAIVGHHDLKGPLEDAWSKSWNFSHPSAGCSQEALMRTGGAGKFYCFAAN